MNRLLRRLLGAMLLGVVVYGAFALYRGWTEVASELARFHWSAFAFACALALANYLLRYVKWEFYLALLRIRSVPKLDSLLAFLSGFVLTVTPGKVGEVFKSVVLHDLHQVAVARTAPIVLADRMTDVLGIVILIMLGSTGFEGGLAWAGAGTGVVLAALLFVSSTRASEAICSRLESAPSGSRSARLAPKVREAWTSLRTMTTLRALVVPTLLSVVAWFMECMALWVVLAGFGEQISVSLATFFYATATLAGALIPVPGGLGVTEATLQEQLSRIGGVATVTSTCSMILVRFATLWFAVFVGFVALAVLKWLHPGLLRDDAAFTRDGAGRARPESPPEVPSRIASAPP